MLISFFFLFMTLLPVHTEKQQPIHLPSGWRKYQAAAEASIFPVSCQLKISPACQAATFYSVCVCPPSNTLSLKVRREIQHNCWTANAELKELSKHPFWVVFAHSHWSGCDILPQEQDDSGFCVFEGLAWVFLHVATVQQRLNEPLKVQGKAQWSC